METKTCTTCQKDLFFDQFYIRNDTGREGTECKGCKIARGKKHYAENTSAQNARVRARYHVFGRFSRYGLTREQYDLILAEQRNLCALCRSDRPGGKGKWCIDHLHNGIDARRNFHVAGKHEVRGLLCHGCNVALGGYEKLVSQIGVERLASYLLGRPLANVPNDSQLPPDQRLGADTQNAGA
jgi:hypothetical protein